MVQTIHRVPPRRAVAAATYAPKPTDRPAAIEAFPVWLPDSRVGGILHKIILRLADAAEPAEKID